MKRNEIEAMTIICNIQQMQKVSYGTNYDYNQFKGKSIEELRELQESLIPVYNTAILNRKSELLELERKLIYAKDFSPHKVEYYQQCITQFKKNHGLENIHTSV